MLNLSVVLFIFPVILSAISAQSQEDPWPLKWFPRNPESQNETQAVPPNITSLFEGSGAPKMRTMGVINSLCDDGKTNLTLDDDGKSHLCTNGQIVPLDTTIEAQIQEYEIPERYVAIHRCMDEKIEYDYRIPTFGTHRGLWPRYGEYSYVPVQRWLHTLEHGGIVMLYHPCADKSQVDALRTIVTNCLFRHVITPSERLTEARPFALVAWGVSIEMANVNEVTVVGFIQSHALNGPEQTSRDGQFDQKLTKAAIVVSDHDDYQLCPKYVFKTDA